MLSVICGIKKMTQMNLSAKQKQTHRHRLTVAKEEGGVGEAVWS